MAPSTGEALARRLMRLMPRVRLSGAAPTTSLRKTCLWVLGPFLATRAAIFAVGALSATVIRPGEWSDAPWGAPTTSVGHFLRWDVEWYLRIVREGYSFDRGQQSTIAFYPVYPTIVRCVTAVGLSDVAAGILVSNVALYVGAVLACRLWANEYGSERIGRTAVVLLFVWPASFFHSTIYSDALFFALLAGVMTASRAGRWLLAGLLGFLLALTRQLGGLFILPLLLDVAGFGVPVDRRPRRAGVGWLAMLPAGTVAYCVFLWRRFGDPIAFMHVGDRWERDVPGVMVTFERLGEREWLYRALFAGTALWLAALMIVMLVAGVRASNAAWCAIVWYTAASSGTLEAIPRLTMVALPIFGFTAALVDRRPTTRELLIATSAMILAVCVILFVNGYWMT